MASAIESVQLFKGFCFGRASTDEGLHFLEGFKF
jgi:hypothetical protein